MNDPREPPRAALSIESELRAGSVRLAVAGELDIATVPQLEGELRSLLTGSATEVVIDLNGLTFIDSSALRMFIVLSNRAASEGWTLRLVRPSEQARAVFEITGANDHLPLEDSADSAGREP